MIITPSETFVHSEGKHSVESNTKTCQPHSNHQLFSKRILWIPGGSSERITSYPTDDLRVDS